MKSWRKIFGFTLVELMVVVAIVAVLVMAIMPKYHSYKARSRRAEATVNLGQLSALQGVYVMQHNKYISIPPAALVGRHGNCDPDAHGSVMKKLGFDPPECAHMRYGYEMSAGGDNFNAVAFAPSDGDGFWIYPKCTGAGLEECGSSSGDKLFVRHNSEVEVCRDIVKHCPEGAGPTITIVSSPPGTPPTIIKNMGGGKCACTTTEGAITWQLPNPSVCVGSSYVQTGTGTNTTSCNPTPDSPSGFTCTNPDDVSVGKTRTAYGTKTSPPCCPTSACRPSHSHTSWVYTPNLSVCKGSSYTMPGTRDRTTTYARAAGACSSVPCATPTTTTENGGKPGIGTNTDPPCSASCGCTCNCVAGTPTAKTCLPNSNTECPGTPVHQTCTFKVPQTCTMTKPTGVSSCADCPACSDFEIDGTATQTVDGTKPGCGRFAICNNVCDCDPWVTEPWSEWTPDTATVCKGTPFKQTRTRDKKQKCRLPGPCPGNCPCAGLTCKDGSAQESETQDAEGTKPCRAKPTTRPCYCDPYNMTARWCQWSGSDAAETCSGPPHGDEAGEFKCSCEDLIIVDQNEDGKIDASDSIEEQAQSRCAARSASEYIARSSGYKVNSWFNCNTPTYSSADHVHRPPTIDSIDIDCIWNKTSGRCNCTVTPVLKVTGRRMIGGASLLDACP